QRARCAVVKPARGNQPDRRLHDVDRPAFRSELDGIRPGNRRDLHRFEHAAAVRLGAEIEPQCRVDITGVAGLDVEVSGEGLDVEVSGEGFDVVDRHELVEPQRKQYSGKPGAISDSIWARISGSSLPKPVSISIAASLWVSR